MTLSSRWRRFSSQGTHCVKTKERRGHLEALFLCLGATAVQSSSNENYCQYQCVNFLIPFQAHPPKEPHAQGPEYANYLSDIHDLSGKSPHDRSSKNASPALYRIDEQDRHASIENDIDLDREHARAYLGIKTVSMTCMTPLDCMTSAIVMAALPPFASSTHNLPACSQTVSASP